MVKTVKSLLEESADPYLVLLAYKTIPLPWCALRTDIPHVLSILIPEWSCLTSFHQKDADMKRKQKANYDRRHRARPLSPLPNSTPVWVHTQDRPDPGRLIHSADTPRSYLVEVPSGTIWRTRVIFHDDLKQTQISQPQKLQKHMSLLTNWNTCCPPPSPPSRLTYWKRGDVAYW